MRNLTVAWIVLLVSIVVFVLLSVNFDIAQIWSAFQSRSSVQQLVMVCMVIAGLWILIGITWQADRTSRLSMSLQQIQRRLDGFRQAAQPVDEAQRGLDAAASHLLSSDPEEAVKSLQERMSEAENRTAAQQGKNRSADFQAQIDDIRQRQQKLRDRLGEVIGERRDMEPVFNELRERQRQLDNTLSELEVDDRRNSLLSRQEETERAAVKSENRLQALQAAFEAFRNLRTQLGKVQGQLEPLQSGISGLVPLADETQQLRDKCLAALKELEAKNLPARIDGLTKSKSEAAQKLQLLEAGQQSLDELRKELVAFGERHDHIERSIADVETNAQGQRLSDRIKDLGDLVTKSRERLWAAQEALVTLGNFKSDIEKMHLDMVPLKAPDHGVTAMTGQVQELLDRMGSTLAQMERQGDATLFARLETFAAGKAQARSRIESIQQCFTDLSAIRGEINVLFASMNESLKKNL
jgi:predicted  nucleic acid-binding Zn-ribbon protein